MTTINTHYTGPRINGDVEPIETATPATGNAAVVSTIASDSGGLDPSRRDTLSSFRLSAPDGNSPAGDFDDLSATGQRIANLSESVQADVFAFMNLFFQMALETRKTASEIRSTEREAKFQELQNAADKIREAGVYQMVAGIVGGVTTIASGALSMAGGLKSLKASSDALGGLKSEKLPNRPIELGDLEVSQGANVGQSPNPMMAQNQAQAISMKFGGLASGVQGAGQIASSGLGFGATVAQTEQKEHETQAEKDQAQVDTANELYQNMQQTIQDVLSRLAAIQQSNSETTKQIVRA
ncbi:MAG: type III secretion system translocon subunit SctB [Candidatus Competibacter sp.]